MPHIGLPELLIVSLLIVIVFGVGRLPEVGGALGKSIREFRKASQAPDEEEKKEEAEKKAE